MEIWRNKKNNIKYEEIKRRKTNGNMKK